MSLFICGFLPKKSAIANGAVAMAITVDAKNQKMATMKSTMLLEGEFPGSSSHFFAPKVCADRVGSPRPPVHDDAEDNAIFSTEWMEHNQWNDETKEFEPIVVDNTDDIDNVKNIFDLPINVRIAYVLLYGVEPEIVDSHLLSNAYDLINDDESEPLYRAVIDGLPRLPQVKHMYITTLAQLIDDVQAHTPVFKSWPDVNKFAEKWINSRPDEREHPGSQANSLPTPAGHRERDYKHDYASLDLEVACALFPGDYDVWEVPSSIYRGAKEKVEKGDEAWRRWSTALRIIPAILAFSRDDLFAMIRGAELDIHKDPAKLKTYINQCLQLDVIKADDVKVANLGDGKFSVDGLTGAANDSLANTDKTEKPKTDTKVPKGATEQPNTAPDTVNSAINDEIATINAKTVTNSQEEPESPIPVSDEFQQRAAQIEHEISNLSKESQDNLSIWKLVQRTDPARTKRKDSYKGDKLVRSVTSINPTYQTMRATEVFGPYGIGWGVDIISQDFIPAIPFMEPVYDDKKREIGRIPMRDSDGTILRTSNHTMQIELWYHHAGRRGKIPAFGHTKHIYQSSYGPICDDEVSKKSLTDATTKALAQLGFSADVFMGLFDDADYIAENRIEFGIKNASTKADDVVRLRKELDDKFKANTETMRSAVTANEVNGICSKLTRELGVHLKTAKETADSEHEKYLSGRLQRLTDIKNECLSKFEGEKA
ncbi:TPA: transcription termination factor [Yersinia enterocolitica]